MNWNAGFRMRLQNFWLNVGSPKLALSLYYITKSLGSCILGIQLFADMQIWTLGWWLTGRCRGRVFSHLRPLNSFPAPASVHVLWLCSPWLAIQQPEGYIHITGCCWRCPQRNNSWVLRRLMLSSRSRPEKSFQLFRMLFIFTHPGSWWPQAK